MVAAGAPPAAAGKHDAFPSATVLLVEDEILIRMDLGEQLRQAGWTVYEAATGDDAILFLRSPILIDLVLTDVRMRGTRDCLQVASFVRQERPGVKIAIMSGHYSPAWDERKLFDCFLLKPVRPDLLAELRKLFITGTEPVGVRSAADEAIEPELGNNPGRGR